MNATLKPLLELTAGDLMTGEPLVLSQDMPLGDAARSLLHLRVEGAPVVDGLGKCVGVLSAVDFVRLFEKCPDSPRAGQTPRPMTCRFQAKLGHDKTLCLLPAGVCPLQRCDKDECGNELVLCRDPHCVLSDWQVVEMEQLPEVPVSRYMTPDPVTVRNDTSIQKLARMMLDAHIHRVVVVDERFRPVGMVTATDVLAAVAYANQE